MKFFFALFFIILSCFGCRSGLTWVKGLEQRPNILLIMTDDATWNDFGFSAFDKSLTATPHIDALCREGVFFSHTYAAGSVGDASVAAILTGRHPVELKYEYGTEGIDLAVNKQFLFLPEYLPKYHSTFIGKWHLGGGNIEEDRPYLRGFEEFYGFIGGGSGYLPWNMRVFPQQKLLAHLKFRASDSRFPGAVEAEELYTLIKDWYTLNIADRQKARQLTLKLNLSALEGESGGAMWPRFSLPRETVISLKKEKYEYSQIPLEKYLTIDLSLQAVEFILDIKRLKDPWLAVVAYNAPHSPREAEPEKLQEFKQITDPKKRERLAVLSSLDDGVEQIIQALKATGQYENTMIIFMNDNGANMIKQEDLNYYRGGKGTLFEGGICVPMFIVYPDRIPAGKEITTPVSVLDLVPTILTEGKVDSKKMEMFKDKFVNLLDMATEKVKSENSRSFYWRQGKISAIRDGKWKLIQISPLIEKAVDLIDENDIYLLFDLEKDPRERNNIALDNLELVDQLQQKLNLWLKDFPERDCQNVLYWERFRRDAHLKDSNLEFEETQEKENK